MLNLTLVSFTLTSSFQKSPFLHFSSSKSPRFNALKNINVNQLFSSFLITQSFNSFSIIKESIFNKFVTSSPVLFFTSNDSETRISNQAFYGDTIPSNNNIFFQTIYTEIVNCKFMSITDSNDEQSLLFGGLCICTTRSTKIDSCYFFAIFSRRTGSAILFIEEYEYIDSTVVNCVFKSITQRPDDTETSFYSGGAVSHGQLLFNDGFSPLYIRSSLTANCCFDKIRLHGSIYDYNGIQAGVVTYVSYLIKSKNLNFTNNEMQGNILQFGCITIYCDSYSENSFSFINIYTCLYNHIGSFSLIFLTEEKQEFSLSFANFINNTHESIEDVPQFGILIFLMLNETFLKLTNIQCNSKISFFGISSVLTDDVIPIDVTMRDSLFGCSFSNFMFYSHYMVLNNLSENNFFDHFDFDVEITNNILSNFGYIQTSQFSPSMFFSESEYVVSESISNAIKVIFVILGIVSIFVFIFILCCHRKTKKIDIEQFLLFDVNHEKECNSIALNTINNERNAESAFDADKKNESKNENINNDAEERLYSIKNDEQT